MSDATGWRDKYRAMIGPLESAQFDSLTEREKTLVRALYDNKNYTQPQMGEMIGVGPTRIGQLLTNIAQKLSGTAIAKETRERPTLSHQQLMELTVWAQANKDKLWGLPLDTMTAVIKLGTGLEVSEKTVASTCKVLKIEIKPKPRQHHVPESARCQVLAKALVKLYGELNVVVPDDLWAMVGGKDE